MYGDNGKLLNLENLDLEEIKSRVGNNSKKNIDVFKTVISLKEEDAIRYGMDKNAWKDIITKRITDIAKASNIPIESIEWTASYHAKKGNPHCHLVFWNKDQNLELNKKPFLNYREIRKSFAKEIFKSELESLYDVKNISKKEIGSLSKEELKKYKDNIKSELKNPDLKFNIIDTSKEEMLIENLSKKLKVEEKVYLYNKKNPEEFAEITKEKEVLKRKFYNNDITEEKEFLTFKNNGEHSLIYKNNDFTDTACFLANFNDIGIAKTQNEMEKIIKDKKDLDLKIDTELREIMPGIVPNSILSNEFREKSFEEITKQIASLENLIKEENKKAGLGEKITFRYDLQQATVKKAIDKIATLILNTSINCKDEYNKYMSSTLDIARLLADIQNKNDYERVKNNAKDTLYNKMGNQILQALKESMKENKEELWNIKKTEFEQKNIDFQKAKDEFEKQVQSRNTRDLITAIFNSLNTSNVGMSAKRSRIKSLSNMTKEQIREYLKMKENSSGFDWFNEM